MNTDEYARMHALETHYWWFVGRRAIIAALLQGLQGRRPGCGISAGTGSVPCPSPVGQEAGCWLDIGCGTGANLPMLRAAAGAARVVGIDYSPLALDFAGRHPESHNVALLRADGLRLPFADDSFEVVTMFDVLEHLRDDKLALCEVRRVLRPGGALVFSVPAYQRLWSAHDEALHHFRRYENHSLRALLIAQGFQVRRLSFAMSLMPPVAWLLRRVVQPLLTPLVPARRSRGGRQAEGGAVLPQVTPALNKALVAYLRLEGRLIGYRPLRFGTSLVGVAVKSAGP
jgi:SAM-dependent methyltransferase